MRRVYRTVSGAIATAWRLHDRTGKARYRDDYLRLWDWSWRHLVDHENGAWFRIVSREGAWIEPYKSPAGKVETMQPLDGKRSF